MSKTRLSVNLNKIAVLRNSRGGSRPNIIKAAETVISAGAQGITLHPRPDMRHVRPDDVRALARLVAGRVEYNLEGNPFAPSRGEYPGFLALVEEVRPDQVTLVPDGDGQITSDHGFDLIHDLGLHSSTINQRRADNRAVAPQHQNFVKLDFFASIRCQLFDTQRITGLNPILLAPGFENRKHSSFLRISASAGPHTGVHGQIGHLGQRA